MLKTTTAFNEATKKEIYIFLLRIHPKRCILQRFRVEQFSTFIEYSLSLERRIARRIPADPPFGMWQSSNKGEDRLLSLYCWDSILGCDAGSDMWNIICEGRNQIEICFAGAAHNTFMHPNVLIFGSTLYFGFWDGLCDVDFACTYENFSISPTDFSKEGALLDSMWRLLVDIGIRRTCIKKVQQTTVPVIRHVRKDRAHRQSFRPSKQKQISVSLEYEQNIPKVMIASFSGYNAIQIKDSLIEVTFVNFSAALNFYVLFSKFTPGYNCGIHVEKNCNDSTQELKSCEERFMSLCVTKQKAQNQENQEKSILDFERNDAFKKFKSLIKPLNAELHCMHVPELCKFDFDVSFRASGIRNSNLIRAYLMQNDLFRAGAFIIKRWGKNSGLSDSRNGFLNSFAMVLLWIFFLIQCDVAEFICAQSIASSEAKTNWGSLYESLNVKKYFDDCFAGCTEPSLGTLIYGFFEFYEEFDWDQNVVNLVQSSSLSKRELAWCDLGDEKNCNASDEWFCMCIQNPYESTSNLAWRMNPDKTSIAKELFRTAKKDLNYLRTLLKEEECIERIFNSLETKAAIRDSLVFQKKPEKSKQCCVEQVQRTCREFIYSQYPEHVPLKILRRELATKVYDSWIVVHRYHSSLESFLRKHLSEHCTVRENHVHAIFPALKRGKLFEPKHYYPTCNECGRKVRQVWFTSKVNLDYRTYCDTCWKQWELCNKH